MSPACACRRWRRAACRASACGSSRRTPRRIATLVALIAREVPEGGAIFAVPFEPQLYFLSRRRNPVRFYNTAIGLRDEAALAETLAILERDKPTLVFFRPDDKYNTALSRALIERLKPRYALIDRIGGLEVYRLR